jgi:hypothetical protein
MPTDEIVYNQKRPDGSFYSGPASGLPPQAPAAPAPTPINRTITQGTQLNPALSTDPVESFANTFRAPESREQIIERRRKESQGLIDSINTQFDQEVEAKKELGSQRIKMDNSISVLTGMMGGTESVKSREGVLKGNEKELEAVNARRATQLAGVYSQISADAERESREQLADATRSADQIIARRKEAQTAAVENLKLLAGTGTIDFEAFQTSPQNKSVYDYALKAVGGSEDALRGLFALSRPKDQILDQRVVGSTMYITYQNPTTGKVRNDHFNLGFEVPAEYDHVTVGDEVLFFPKGGSVAEAMRDGSAYTYKASPSQKDLLAMQASMADIQNKGLQNLKLEQELTGTDAKTANAKQAAITQAQTSLEAVKELYDYTTGKTAAGFDKAVGVKGLTNYLPGTDAASFRAKLERVKSLVTLPELQKLRGLGAMSDREFATLSSAAGALDASMSEQAFKTELERIHKALQSTVDAGGAAAPAPDATATYELNGVIYTQGSDGNYYPQQ